MKTTLTRLLIDYCKGEGKKLKDLRGELLDLALSLYNDGGSLDLSPNEDFSNLHNKIVQDIIDYINSHEEVRKKIQEEKEKISKEIQQETGHGHVPDLRAYFSVNCLEDSVEHGEWVPSTDSSLEITLGPTISIILSA